MRVIIKSDYNESSVWAARYIAQRIRDFAPTEEKPFVLGLPTGSTPLGCYAELIRLYKAGEVSFKNVVTFNMDEYVGLAEDHPQSYHFFMKENFFKHVDIQEKNVHILNGMASNLQEECESYEKSITSYGKIHLFLGGIGVDGHIAFNEPFSSLQSRTREKALTQNTIEVNARFFDNDVSQVPKTALTVGIGTILDAEEVVIIATGSAKARALYHGIEEGINHKWTISALQSHPCGIVVCDTPATEELNSGTVQYFKEIESKRTDFSRYYE